MHLAAVAFVDPFLGKGQIPPSGHGSDPNEVETGVESASFDFRSEAHRWIIAPPLTHQKCVNPSQHVDSEEDCTKPFTSILLPSDRSLAPFGKKLLLPVLRAPYPDRWGRGV